MNNNMLNFMGTLLFCHLENNIISTIIVLDINVTIVLIIMNTIIEFNKVYCTMINIVKRSIVNFMTSFLWQPSKHGSGHDFVSIDETGW